jgi:Zn-finger nucleic acid-binding protein
MDTCPRCKAPLTARAVGRATMQSCWGCGGVFVAATALAALLFAATPGDSAALGAAFDGPPARPPPVRMAWCPCCAGPMVDRALVEGAPPRVAVCRSHGVWIDGAHVPGAMQVLAMRAVGRAGDLERAAFADDLRRNRWQEILGHARELAARNPPRALVRSPLGLLASLFA